MLLFAGVLLLALGLLSGAVLVLAPFGVAGAQAALTLWATFPVLSLAGFALAAVQGRADHVRLVSLVASGVLLALAMASITAIVLAAAKLIREPTTSAPLWFVLVVGLVLGSVGAASFRRARAEV